MRLVYVAGAFNASGGKSIRDNVYAAEIAGIEVAGAGVMPIVPHALTVNMSTAQTEAFWYEGTAELLRRCDAVYVFNVEHVETSKGTRDEVDLANSMHLPVFIDLASLREWLALDAKRDDEIRELVVGMGLPAEMAPKRRFER